MLTCIFPLLDSEVDSQLKNIDQLFFSYLSQPRIETLPHTERNNIEVPAPMDVREAVGALTQLEFSSLGRFPLFYNPGSHMRLFFHGRDVYLRISDFLLDENGRMRDSVLLRMPEDAAAIAAFWPEGPGPWLRSLDVLQPMVNMDNFLAQIQSSTERSVRIYIEQGLGPRVFKTYFSADATDATRRTHTYPTTLGYNGLSFQWRAPKPNTWFEAPSFILTGQDSPGLVINVKRVSTVEHSGDRLICKQLPVAALLLGRFIH